MVPVAFGTQTGGSVLRPAAYCGVVGYKPTFSLINRARHLVRRREPRHASGSSRASLDDVELVTRRAGSAAPSPASRARSSAARFGLCRTPLWDKAQPETVAAIEDAAARLAAAGATVREIVLPDEFSRAAATPRARPSTITSAPPRMAHEWNNHRASDQRGLGERIAARLRHAARGLHRGAAARRSTAARGCRRCSTASMSLAPCVNGEAPRGLGETGDPGFQQIWTVLHTPCPVAAHAPRAERPAGRHPARRAAP